MSGIDTTLQDQERINLEALLHVGQSDARVQARATELDALTGSGLTALEFATQKEPVASVAIATTPATGSCAVQCTFSDPDAVQIAHVAAGLMYISNSAGTAIAAATSVATLTNGAIQELVAGKVDLFITSAAGLLGFTLTAGTGTYYASFVLPNGRVITTGAIVCN